MVNLFLFFSRCTEYLLSASAVKLNGNKQGSARGNSESSQRQLHRLRENRRDILRILLRSPNSNAQNRHVKYVVYAEEAFRCRRKTTRIQPESWGIQRHVDWYENGEHKRATSSSLTSTRSTDGKRSLIIEYGSGIRTRRSATVDRFEWLFNERRLDSRLHNLSRKLRHRTPKR